ncbi:DUF3261 domain-containing protein [uncultured Desulfobacter sp.]|uniref:DUF3261 domain-containing protein n=1 Tax=uncultured Desulfobacter sp. TaxID=240139 RepID=UPI002AAB60BC|nr:DUF3261 domain-containing protein [uncultured Desulfobacter sp.]
MHTVSETDHCMNSGYGVDQLTRNVRELYPAGFRALHQVVLQIHGKSMSMNGFLKIDRPKGRVDLVAQTPMGGTLFEVHICRGQQDIILTKGFLKEKWLGESVVQDLKRLYLVPDFNSCHICEQEKQILLCESDGQRVVRYCFIKNQQSSLTLTEIMFFNKNRLIYKIEYQYESGNQLPGAIRIENKKTGYILTVNQHIIPDKNPSDRR